MIASLLEPVSRPIGRDLMDRPLDLVTPNVNVSVRVWKAGTPAAEDRARRGIGELLAEQVGHNLVPTAGRNLLRDLLDRDAADPGPITKFGLGSSNAATSNNDTALGVELARDDISNTIASDLKLQVQYFLPSTSLNGSSIWEAGLFTAGGRLYARYVLSALADIQPKTSGVAVTFTWDLAWTVTAMNILERGSVVELGGDANAYSVGNAYPSGATLDKIVNGSSTWLIDSADLQGGTFALEGHVKTTPTVTCIPTIGLVNLTDGAPNTALTGSEVSGSSGNTTGERIRSGAITFPAAGAAKQLAVKVRTSQATGEAIVWGLRIVRLT